MLFATLQFNKFFIVKTEKYPETEIDYIRPCTMAIQQNKNTGNGYYLLGLASFRRHHHDVGDLGPCRRWPKSALRPSGSYLGGLRNLRNLDSLHAELENRCKTFFACRAKKIGNKI